MQTRKGFSVVEIVVAAALIATVVTAAAGAWQLYLRLTTQTAGLTAAALLAEEGGEALQLLRDQSWNANIVPLALNTTYYLYWNGTAYAATTSPVLIQNAYLRTVVLGAVNRNAVTYNITSTSTSCSGNCDTNSRDAVVSVYFASTTAPLVQSEVLINNVFGN